jgi:hypothetical protein
VQCLTNLLLCIRGICVPAWETGTCRVWAITGWHVDWPWQRSTRRNAWFSDACHEHLGTALSDPVRISNQLNVKMHTQGAIRQEDHEQGLASFGLTSGEGLHSRARVLHPESIVMLVRVRQDHCHTPFTWTS